MGCCESSERGQPQQEQYVTESDEEDQQFGQVFGSYSSSSESSFDEDVLLTERSRLETIAAIEKNSTVGHALRNSRSNLSVVNTPKISHGLDEDGTHYVNEYIIIRTIGRGSYGKVKLCIHAETGESYAIKIINKVLLGKKRKGGFSATSLLDDVRREIAILDRIDHPHCVKLYEVIDDVADDKLYMIFEHVPGGALMRGIVEQEPLDLSIARRYVRDIVLGLEYLHHMHIVHRDIKPENLLSGENGIVISDFGVSVTFGDSDLLERTEGTPAFLAPEVVSGDGSFSGCAVDVWALGVTLYSFIFGTLPFMAESEFAIYDKIRESPLEFPHPIDDLLTDLLSRLLDKDPTTRITISEIKQHPWITLNGAAPMEEQDLPAEVPPPIPEITTPPAINHAFTSEYSESVEDEAVTASAVPSTRDDGDTRSELSPNGPMFVFPERMRRRMSELSETARARVEARRADFAAKEKEDEIGRRQRSASSSGHPLLPGSVGGSSSDEADMWSESQDGDVLYLPSHPSTHVHSQPRTIAGVGAALSTRGDRVVSDTPSTGPIVEEEEDGDAAGGDSS